MGLALVKVGIESGDGGIVGFEIGNSEFKISKNISEDDNEIL
jgi:hypothetical protein